MYSVEIAPKGGIFYKYEFLINFCPPKSKFLYKKRFLRMHEVSSKTRRNLKKNIEILKPKVGNGGEKGDNSRLFKKEVKNNIVDNIELTKNILTQRWIYTRGLRPRQQILQR